MKNLFFGALAFVVLSTGNAGPASAQTHSRFTVRFEKPFLLNGRGAIKTEKVKLAVRDNVWKELSSRSRSRTCDFQIRIEGRDLAKENQLIGEHYFGSLDVTCSNFKTRFSRVLFLGIRACVRSETVFDQDYCSLKVAAYRREQDMNEANGDLISSTGRKKSYYRIDSPTAERSLRAGNLIPRGLNLDAVDSYQLFEISVGKLGNDFFVKSPNANSNFAQGENVFLTVDPTAISNDETLRDQITAIHQTLASQLASVGTRQNPAAYLDDQLPAFLTSFSSALEKLLGIIGPVEFFQAETKLKSLEYALIHTLRTYRPEISNRSQFRTAYGNLPQSYLTLSEYLPEPVLPALPNPNPRPSASPVPVPSSAPMPTDQYGCDSKTVSGEITQCNKPYRLVNGRRIPLAPADNICEVLGMPVQFQNMASGTIVKWPGAWLFNWDTQVESGTALRETYSTTANRIQNGGGSVRSIRCPTQTLKVTTKADEVLPRSTGFVLTKPAIVVPGMPVPVFFNGSHAGNANLVCQTLGYQSAISPNAWQSTTNYEFQDAITLLSQEGLGRRPGLWTFESERVLYWSEIACQ